MVESLKVISALIWPVMPDTARDSSALGPSEERGALTLEDLRVWAAKGQ